MCQTAKEAPHPLPTGYVRSPEGDSKCPALKPEVQPTGQLGGSLKRDCIEAAVTEYEDLHASEEAEERKKEYYTLVTTYYNLVTSFYEYGWGQSFHFAHRFKGETLKQSILRHEYYLALRLKLTRNMRVLDVGCGIGGPLRNISAFSGAEIHGLNSSSFQIKRGKVLNRRYNKGSNCQYIEGDFMKMPIENAAYDGAYAIEATCHAPDIKGCFQEIYRVLKPGTFFACYEWCLTINYDGNNGEHRRIKQDIQLGNGIPELRTSKEVVQALKDVGFEVLEARDVALDAEVAWYDSLATNKLSFHALRATPVGRFLTRYLVWALEKIGMAPPGSLRVNNFLEKGGDALVAGGVQNIFTPMFFFYACKPLL